MYLARSSPALHAEGLIEINSDIWRDKHVRRLARRLGVTHAAAVGMLFLFWVWVCGDGGRGFAPGATADDVDRVAATPGFGDALARMGWLRFDADG